MDVKIASLQYRYDFPKNFDAYRKKILNIVKLEASRGVQLLLFPEYAGMEMISFAPLEKMFEDLSRYLELFQELSNQYKMWICSGTHVVQTEEGVFNRSYFFSPKGSYSYQDKCSLTPYEVEEGILSEGKSVRLFDTDFGKIGICICYDVEFPKIVKTLVDAGAQLLLVPSYTSSVQGFYRVFLCCRARALENQCYVVQSALVGQTDVEMTYGASAICGPVDEHFPEDGLIALGKRDQVESVFGIVDLGRLKQVRASGQTRNYTDGRRMEQRSISLESFDLR